MNEAADKCSNPPCQKGPSGGLMACKGCKKTHYCSKDCYEKDWENHKTYCKHVSSEGKSSASLVPLDYFMKIATHVPKARALAREINLPMANPSGMYPLMRQLVTTGKDTPENIALFFGQGKPDSIKQAHDYCKKEVQISKLLEKIATNSLDQSVPDDRCR